MSDSLRFVKMQASGNDFILLDGLSRPLPRLRWGRVARKLCDRHFGVGADGLILVLPSRRAEFRMRVFNPDGSEAEACGNGLRCFAKFVYEHGFTCARKFALETLGGIVVPELRVRKGRVRSVRVDMGPPRLKPSQIPAKIEGEKAVNVELEAGGRKVRATLVSMGNPHCVVFVNLLERAPVPSWAPNWSAIPSSPIAPTWSSWRWPQNLTSK